VKGLKLKRRKLVVKRRKVLKEGWRGRKNL